MSSARTLAALTTTAGLIAIPALTAPPLTAVGASSGPPPASATTSGPAAAKDRGRPAVFESADKEGFGTAYGTRSKVWFTLRDGALSDVYYPVNSTPSVRNLQLVVTDGRTFTDTEQEDMRQQVELVDEQSLSYQQTNIAKSGKYRITKTYTTDPHRNTVLVHVTFKSLTGKPYQVYLDYLPALDNDGHHNTARRVGDTLLAKGPESFSALRTLPALRGSTNEYDGRRGGLDQLRRHHELQRHRSVVRDGTVEQTARTKLTGVGGGQRLTVALGFGGNRKAAKRAAAGSLDQGFLTTWVRYQRTWSNYLDSLAEPPSSLATAHEQTTYNVSVMALAASEDKTYRGAFIASPSMPWAWRRPATNAPNPPGPYHLVWSRDLYQIATGLMAAGDDAAGRRSVRYLFGVQQEADGGFPQNSTADGTPYWTGAQLDQYALPIVLAWQLEMTDAKTWQGVRKAAAAIIDVGPGTEQERWENQGGFSPGTIAAEIAGLVCAAEIATANDRPALAERYLEVADRWQANVKRWTASSNGPLSDDPYFLRIAKGGHPNRGTTYAIGDSGPAAIDQRRVVDPSFLELVRLGVLAPDDPVVLNTLDVVDRKIRVDTPAGPFWHRFSFDGYGETADGGDWVIEGEGTPKTFGRLWPLLTGERGEYAILAGDSAGQHLETVASTTSEGFMLPEQVWDGRPPTGEPGKRIGTPTRSATPLLWTHAEFVRLAHNVADDAVAERPSVVYDRYVS